MLLVHDRRDFSVEAAPSRVFDALMIRAIEEQRAVRHGLVRLRLENESADVAEVARELPVVPPVCCAETFEPGRSLQCSWESESRKDSPFGPVTWLCRVRSRATGSTVVVDLQVEGAPTSTNALFKPRGDRRRKLGDSLDDFCASMRRTIEQSL
jgi:hypothetical protein